MSNSPRLHRFNRLAFIVLAFVPSCAGAQRLGSSRPVDTIPARETWLASGDTGVVARDSQPVDPPPAEKRFRSRADSLDWVAARRIASKSEGFRLVVSLQDRRLWAIVGEDTVLNAPVATAKGTSLSFAGHTWTFRTPRGVRKVLGKEADPMWIPPDWLYAEVANEHGLKMRRLTKAAPVKLSDGRSVVVRDSLVGVLGTDKLFYELPTDEHIVFDSTLFIPPIGTRNRVVEGELGKYRLDLGEGYLLHGTPDKESIGFAATHGCVRLRDDDIEWLYTYVPVGTRVYIF